MAMKKQSKQSLTTLGARYEFHQFGICNYIIGIHGHHALVCRRLVRKTQGLAKPGSDRLHSVCNGNFGGYNLEACMKQKLMALPGMALIALIAVLELIAILFCGLDNKENGYD
jgi:hypothetical protein